MTTAENLKYAGLTRGLGLWAATAVVVGSIIGQAIFLVPGDIARELSSQMAVMVDWTIGGLSRGLGAVWGFLYGWTSAMIMRPASAATIAAGLLRFATFLLPSLTTPIFIWHIWIPFQSQPCPFTLTLAQPFAAAMIALVTVINYFGVRTAGRFQILLSSLEVAAISAIVILLARVAGFSLCWSPLRITAGWERC